MKPERIALRKLAAVVFGFFISLFLIPGCMPPASEIDSENVASVAATATEGYFTDRVMVSWSEVPGASKYIIYRSESPDGPYEKVTEVTPDSTKSRVENADMLIEVPVVEEPPAPEDPDYIDPVYLNFTYTSEADLSGGRHINAGQTPRLRILIGSALEGDADVNLVAEFPTLDTAASFFNGLWSWISSGFQEPVLVSYEPGQIASILNGAANRAICEVSEDGKNLVFSSKWGPIVFKNENNTIGYSPIDYFIKEGVGNDEILVANKDGYQVMSASDYNNTLATDDGEGNPLGLAAFFGTEPEPEEEPVDTGPEMIARVFGEDDAFFHDDINNETGVHYYYRIQALRDNGTQVSLSNCAEGFKISATAAKAPQNLSVSKGEFSDKTVISWDPVSGSGIVYKIYRALAYPGIFDSSAPLAEVTETTYEDTSVPAGQFVYRVVAFNAAGEEGRPSENVVGYRSATNREFLHVAYYETVVAEKRTAQALGVGRVADYDSGSNANINIFGYLSGKVNYTLNVNISSMSGTGTWSFTDYCNYSVILNGSDSMDSGSDKDGDIRGVVEVSGIYNGYIDYYVHVDGGDVASGYFMVSQNGGPEERIDWSGDFNNSPY